METLLNPRTQQRLDLLIKDLPQSVVLTGPIGVGLTATAEYIANAPGVQAMFVLPEKDEKVDIEKGTITVDVVRRLYAKTKTIETAKRLVVIDYAERMGIQAQNAFLKLLEEPGVNTHFILLSHSMNKLLPTIRSRVQAVTIEPITTEQSQTLLDTLNISDAQKRAQLLFIAGGLPALLSRLAHDEKAFETRAQVIRDARTYLQGTVYDRQKIALQYKDSRQLALILLLDAMKLLQGSLSTSKNPDQVKKIQTLLDTYDRIEANGNIRLQLASVVL